MAYYSKLRPTIYHEYKNCNVGNSIVKGNLMSGKPPRARLCKICAALRASGRAIPGVPELPRPYGIPRGPDAKIPKMRRDSTKEED